MGRNTLNKVDWSLPDLKKFSEADIAFFKRNIYTEDNPDGAIVNSIASVGWSYWPRTNQGFLDANLLRKIADFIEICNKPFWDEYDKYCAAQEPPNETELKEMQCLEELGSTPIHTSFTEE